jgi:aminopeptidase N
MFKKYLNKYVYGNAVQDYLWDTLEEVAKSELKIKDLILRDVMNTWTRQMGHPVITVRKLNDRSVSLTQNHFLLDPSSKPSASPFK